MLKVEKRKSIFDIANVIGNVRTDLSVAPVKIKNIEKNDINKKDINDKNPKKN